MLMMLEKVIRKAADIMTGAKDARVSQKDGHANYVTQADYAVQEYLRGALAQLLPGSLFLAEEQRNDPLTPAPTWVVDPIDGTLNYMRGRNCSAVSIALLTDSLPTAAMVFNPYLNELFSAEKDKGSTLNGQSIRVSEHPLASAVVAFGTTPYNPGFANSTFRAAKAFLLQTADIRRTGSAALDLCDVACGRADVFFEMSLSPWDYAAGALIVTEAGGSFDMPFEQAIAFSKPAGIFASNQTCRSEALDILRNAVKEVGA
jgi:myo-inositol-1(or 4)-monophosphatase